LAVATEFEIYHNSAPKFTFGGTLEAMPKFTLLRHVLKITSGAGVFITSLN
jgi:hypothetical protein